MKKTFEGYIRSILKQKTGIDTASLRRLVPLALADPSLVEPVFIFAQLRNKKYHLMSLVWNTPLEREYRAALHVMNEEGSLEAFLQSKRTPASYRRVYTDYLHHPSKEAAQKKADEKDIRRLRERTLKALEASGITRYRLCSDLKLNPGNVYAYLAGNDGKVSRETAQRICDYAYEALDRAARGETTS